MKATAFSPDYLTARQRILAAAQRLGWDTQTHALAERGPDGELLALDVIVGPSVRSDRTLVISSGLHGVEGLFGSAVQLALLEQWIDTGASRLPVRCVFLHALNPYGFAWRRRANEHNVDLNRNMLLADETFSGGPSDYATFDGYLNPKRPPTSLDLSRVRAVFTLMQHGLPALKRAVAYGQHDFPQGLFYGGAQPSWLTGMLASQFGAWLEDSRQVIHLDFHTGLGPWAGYRLLIEQPLTGAERARCAAWFGSNSFERPHEDGIAYRARGTLGRWCVSQAPGVDYVYAVAEFGTYGPLRMIAGLREENQAHHWCAAGDARIERARHRLAELFCPRSDRWRAQVLLESHRLVSRSLAVLADR